MGNGYGLAVTGRGHGLGKNGDDRVTEPDEGVLARHARQPLDGIWGRLRVSARPRPRLVVCRVVRETGGGGVIFRTGRRIGPRNYAVRRMAVGTNITGTGLPDDPEHGDAPAAHDVG